MLLRLTVAAMDHVDYDIHSGRVAPMPTDRFPLSAYDDFLSDKSELEDDICPFLLNATPQGQGPQARRTNALSYPGNMLECIQEEAPHGFPASNLVPTVAALNIEPQCNVYCLFSLSLRFWRVQNMGGMN
jgi:hypothetical protein